MTASWLAGHSAVLVLTFDIDAESCVLAEGRRYAANPSVMTHQAYGPRVGTPRILDMLNDYGVKATFFVPGVTAERYPALVERIVSEGHEVGHHSHTHRPPQTLSEDEERRDFDLAFRALGKLGVTPRGHRAALWAPHWSTAALVAEYGLAYQSNLMDDDRPYVLQTARGRIAELPPHWSLDDYPQYAYMLNPDIGQNVESPRKAVEVWTLELDAMRDYGCLMVLTNHPFLSGRPARVKALRSLIEFAVGAGDVEITTCAAVADRVLSNADAPVRSHEPIVVDHALYPVL
ncbi:MAG: peptidoglycan-N-acetylglucosamine deacetylase [Mycobacterium sp.]|nr:peptidoglycan-N-acetylglucosamine deacetylase [Mycobacterium sp.]